jgi:hypothetical protein
MYPQYDDTEEGRALEALNHPSGEEYPGAHDSDKKTLADHGWSQDEIEKRFGPSHGGYM